MTDKKITKKIRNLYLEKNASSFIPISILYIILIITSIYIIVDILMGLFNPFFLFTSSLFLFVGGRILTQRQKIMNMEIPISEKIDFLILERNTLENSLFKNKELQEKYEKLRELERQKGELLNNVEGVDHLIENISV